jgi:hypothetical protein
MLSAAAPCSMMRFRAARATSRSIAMSDYGAHGDRFANRNPTASLPQRLHSTSRSTFDNTARRQRLRSGAGTTRP